MAAVHHALEHHFVRQARAQLGRPGRLCDDVPNFGDADIEGTAGFAAQAGPKQLAGLHRRKCRQRTRAPTFAREANAIVGNVRGFRATREALTEPDEL